MKKIFRFFRAGGLEQLLIENDNDLAAVETLDPKLWVATSMPTKGLEFDERTLSLVDTDGDGRIRLQEIKKAVAFARENFADTKPLFDGKDTLPLAAIKSESPAKAAAEYVLRCLKEDAGTPLPSISLAQTEAAFKNFSEQPFNGDGVLTLATACGDAKTETLLKDLITATGGTQDASGKLGITEELLAAFSESAKAAIAWHDNSAAASKTIFPLGEEKTVAAWSAISAVRAKVEDFFARTHLASFDPNSAKKLNPTEDEFGTIASGEITGEASKAFPLARIVVADGVPALPLVCGVNPAWAGALANLRDSALVPALSVPADCTEITETQWRQLLAKFSEYETWFGKKPEGNIHALPLSRIQEIIAQKPAEMLAPLFERDKSEEPHRDALESLERLCRYSRDLLCLLRNYVSFADFYALSDKTIFTVGKLYLDRRACALCICVADAGTHSTLAAKSNCCLVYCNCTRRSDGKAMTIAAVFGDGDSDYLSVGRNGVFFDKKGNDWDATITKIVEQPISIRQAFWSPYKKFARFVETQINNFAAAREKKVEGNMSASAGNVVASPTAPKPAFDMAKFVGIFAAVGLALGAIGGALAALGSGFMSLSWWQMPLAILGVILLISCPSMLLTAMKLRQRTLGPILDANSWAINGCVKINIPLGKAYTEMPKKPAGSKVCGNDPFPSKAFPWGKLLITLVLLGVFIFATVKYCPFVRKQLHLDSIEAVAPASTEKAPAPASATKSSVPATPATAESAPAAK